MKVLITLLLLAVSSTNSNSSKDETGSHKVYEASLQQHRVHSLLFTPVNQRDGSDQFIDYSDMASTIGFCLRNYEETGITDAAMCMGNTWKDRKVAPAMLQTIFRKAFRQVKDDEYLGCDISDDATIQTMPENTITWKATGTITWLNGTATPYTRTGLLSVSLTRITFDDVAQIDQKGLQAQAAIYVDIDISRKVKDNLVKMMAAVNGHHATRLAHTDHHGSYHETGHNGQVVINVATTAEIFDSDVKVNTLATTTASQIAYVNDYSADGTVKSHTTHGQSHAVDMDETLGIDIGSSPGKILGTQYLVGAVSYFVDGTTGSPPRENYCGEITKNVTLFGTADEPLNIMSRADSVYASTFRDEEDLLVATTTGTGVIQVQLDVVVGPGKTETVKGNGTSSLQVVLSPANRGPKTIFDIHDTLTAQLKIKDNGGDTSTAHSDVSVTEHIHVNH